MKPSIFQFLARGPIQCFFFAFILALIYTVLPNLNFWFYNLCKQQFWAICAVIAYTEIQELGLPDASDFTYMICYIVAIFIPPVIHVSSYFTTARNNYALNAMDVTTSVIFIMVAYLLDAYRNPMLNMDTSGRDSRTDEFGIGRVSSVIFDLYDTFDLALSASEAKEPSDGQMTQPDQGDFEGTSRCRAKFIVTQKGCGSAYSIAQTAT
jgi:hypothetical protein